MSLIQRGFGLHWTCSILHPVLTATNFIKHHYATEATQSRPKKTPLVRVVSGMKTFKPMTPGLRHLRQPHNPHLWSGKPVRLLTIAKRAKGGRNSDGHITVRHRGGGHKRRIRIVDFRRMQPGTHDVIRIEYDPGRSGHVALVRNRDPNADASKIWSYILACEGLRPGHVVQSFRQGIPKGMIPGFDEDTVVEAAKNLGRTGDAGETGQASAGSLAIGILRSQTIKPGNVLPLKLIPTGTMVHCISLTPLGAMILVRSAGAWGQIVLHEEAGKYTHVRLQSGEVRKVLSDCCATVGKVSNGLHKLRSLGKAGRSRWLGIRPSVRGVAMNKNDHPHGGGRGKSKSNKHPVSPWGWGTKGTRTRKPGPRGPKNSNKMVITERPRGVKKRKN